MQKYALLVILFMLSPFTLSVVAGNSAVPLRDLLFAQAEQANGHSLRPSISADGRFVAFSSLASNLVLGDTNNASDVFVHDRQTGQTTRVSVASDGTEGNGDSPVFPSNTLSISADGRFVAFQSEASNLVSGDTNICEVNEEVRLCPDIFVHDRQTGQTTRVSVASDGAQAKHSSWEPFISADGRFVTFYSAYNLVPGDTNGYVDIFAHDRQTGETTRVSVASDGTQANGSSWEPFISADGRFVAFYSFASNLVSGDTGIPDVFVHDRQTGQTTRVSVNSAGAQGNNWSYTPSISADGRFVTFPSNATNLVPDDTNGYEDIFVHDRQTGQTTRVSVSSAGIQGNGGSDAPNISVDGRFVTFASVANNLVPDDTNGFWDVFVHDRLTGQTTRVSVPSGTPLPILLSISSVKLRHQLLPEKNWVDVTSTTDGNILQFLVKVSNASGSPQSVYIRIRETTTEPPIVQTSTPITFNPGSSPEVKLYWDTTGYAWNDDGTYPPESKRELYIELIAADQQTVVNRVRKVIAIRPKPVILVHGFTGNHCNWLQFRSYLSSARSDWFTYAVGDGQDVVGTNLPAAVLDMGSMSLSCGKGIDTTTNGILQNAEQMNSYIERIRSRVDAWHVDIVAHSMGGLVSRMYVQAFMPPHPYQVDTIGPTPLVNHLIMLGTPNLGSLCAYLGLLGAALNGTRTLYQPAAMELSPPAVAVFNLIVDKQRDVPFYVLAGTVNPNTCLDGLGDGAVTVASAHGIPLDKAGSVPSDHVALVNDVSNFNVYVKHWLAVGPSGAQNIVGFNQDFQALAVQAEAQAPQIIFSENVVVAKGATASLVIPVPTTTGLGITTIAPSNVSLNLLDPFSEVVQSIAANSPEAYIPFQTLQVDSPTVGNWTLRLINHGTSAATIPVSAYIEGSPVVLNLNLGIPDAAGRVQTSATLTDNGSPVTGATVSARVSSIDGVSEGVFTLVDDGLNGEGSANDGIYGRLLEPLPPGIHSVSVVATGNGFVRATGGLVEIVSFDLSLSMTDTPDPVFPGTNLTYTLKASNNGPSDAAGVTVSNTLPADVAFVSATSDSGTICTQNTGVVTCEIGTLFRNSSVTIDIVVTPSIEGMITNNAIIISTGVEANTVNNSAGVETNVSLIAPSIATGLLLPMTHQAINIVTPTFSWNETSNAVSYEIEIDNNSDFGSPEQNQSVIGLTYEASELTDGIYFWHVRPVNSAGSGPWSEVWDFTVDTLPPSAPNLNGPDDGQITFDTQPTFSWSQISDADHYEVWLDVIYPPLNLVYSAATSNYTPPAPLTPGVYYWQVMAVDAAGNLSSVMEVRSVNVLSADNAAPLRNYYTTSTPTLTWERISWAVAYQVEVDNQSNFSSPEFQNEELPPETLRITTSPLSNGTYQWRVRAKRSDGRWGSWSRPDTFVVQVTGG